MLLRSEFGSEGPLEVIQPMKRIFASPGRIMTIRVEGRDLWTTSEHLVWMQGRG